MTRLAQTRLRESWTDGPSFAVNDGIDRQRTEKPHLRGGRQIQASHQLAKTGVSDNVGGVKRFCFQAMPQSLLLELSCLAIHTRSLLEARVIVTTYNQHVRLLSPEPWLVGTTKAYSGIGADIVMESITLTTELLL